MDSRERPLTAIHNQKPDRLPCRVHGWRQAYLDTYLDGKDPFEAYLALPGSNRFSVGAPAAVSCV
jgi:hypothetical protein